MRRQISYLSLASILAMGTCLAMAGCNWNRPSQESLSSQAQQRQRDEKTRDEVAKATERLKPGLERAGKELGEATERAAEQARAAAEGVKEGWAAGAHDKVDLNSASEKELTSLTGIKLHDAERIIHGRPYSEKRDLVSRHILSESRYAQIQDQVVAR
jgi:DNA uptake protein ComE-like DNA-binding protein